MFQRRCSFISRLDAYFKPGRFFEACMKTIAQVRLRIFSRVHAALRPALSVGWSVGHTQLLLAFFIVLRHFQSFLVILSYFKTIYLQFCSLLVFQSYGVLVLTTACDCKVLAFLRRVFFSSDRFLCHLLFTFTKLKKCPIFLFFHWTQSSDVGTIQNLLQTHRIRLKD